MLHRREGLALEGGRACPSCLWAFGKRIGGLWARLDVQDTLKLVVLVHKRAESMRLGLGGDLSRSWPIDSYAQCHRVTTAPTSSSLMNLHSAIVHLLSEQREGLSARDIGGRLRRQGILCSRRDVNSILYRYKASSFWSDGARIPLWYINGVSGSDGETTGPLASPDSAADPAIWEFSLRQWQADALEAWHRANRSAVVEAVTGTGKTLIGIAAVAQTVASGGAATGGCAFDRTRSSVVE